MICENCGREHDGSYGSGRFCSDHCRRSFCGKKSPGAKVGVKQCHKKARKPGGWTCIICGKVFPTRRDKQAHSHQEHSQGKCSKCAWNKGLTKETSEIVRKNALAVSISLRNGFSSGRLDAKKSWTVERRMQQSERKKLLYLEHPEKHPNRKLANNRGKMTYLERVAFDWLVSHNINFEHQYHFVTKEFNRYVDFFCKDYNLFIEIDGLYWHKDSDKDKRKDDDALMNGFNTIRINSKERIEEKLDKIFSHLIEGVV